MAESVQKLKLGENHRRAVSVVLQLLEKMCDDFEVWIARKSGLLNRVQDDLSMRQRERLRGHIEELRFKLGRITHDVEVDFARKSPRGAIMALLLSNITNLEETDSARLHGYGRMSEEAARRVDAEMARLLAILEQMMTAMEKG